MSRPVLLILMLLAGWWWLSRLGTRSSRSSGQGQTASGGQGSAKRPTEPEASQPIEQCAVCGVHAPRTGMSRWRVAAIAAPSMLTGATHDARSVGCRAGHAVRRA